MVSLSRRSNLQNHEGSSKTRTETRRVETKTEILRELVKTDLKTTLVSVQDWSRELNHSYVKILTTYINTKKKA